MESRRTPWFPACPIMCLTFHYAPAPVSGLSHPLCWTWQVAPKQGPEIGKNSPKGKNWKWRQRVVSETPGSQPGPQTLRVESPLLSYKVRVTMGNDLSKAEKHYLQLVRHLLQTARVQVKEEQLTQLLSESESEVTQSCLTLCDPMDCSLPGFSVHGIFQARILEWGAISFSKKGLLNCCASRPDWLFQLLEDSLRIVFDRVPNNADAADLGTTLWQIPIYMHDFHFN